MNDTDHGQDSTEDGRCQSVWSWFSDRCFDDGQMRSGAVVLERAGKYHLQPILQVCPVIFSLDIYYSSCR